MKTNGFEADIPEKVADAAHMRLLRIPDAPELPTQQQLAWQDIVDNRPVLRREIARLSYEAAPNDADLRGLVASKLIDLFMVMSDAYTTAELEASFGQPTTATTLIEATTQETAS